MGKKNLLLKRLRFPFFVKEELPNRVKLKSFPYGEEESHKGWLNQNKNKIDEVGRLGYEKTCLESYEVGQH